MLARVKALPPEASAGSPAAIRAFDIVSRQGPLTRAALRAALGASPSTISGAVRDLQLRGFVTESGADVSTGGRKPRFLDLPPSLGSVLAADVGAINIRVAVADVRGRILERRTLPTPADPDRARFRRHLLMALAEVAADAPKPVLAVAVAVAGTVDEATHEVSVETVPGWPPGDPAVWLAELGAPVFIENEANLAALGDYSRAGARGPGAVLFVAIGAGIGAGLIIGGELYRGATGSAGKIGFLRRSLDSPPYELEQEAAAGAVVRLYRDQGGDSSRETAEDVFARAAAGDPAAEAAVAAVADELAVGIANAIIVVDPERVVLGGGLGASTAQLLEPLRERIARLVPLMPELVVSELGPDAALAGATARAAQEARRLLRDRLARELNG